MKQPKKDEILQIAFGDTNDSARLEQIRETSPESIQEINALRNIKLNLQQLPVPECQLSTERLRDAILNRGLDTVATKNNSVWKLAWIPVAALAVTFLITKSSRVSQVPTEPRFVAASKPTDLDSVFNTELSRPSTTNIFENALSNPAVVQEIKPQIARKSRSRKPSDRSESSPGTLVAINQPTAAAKTVMTAMEGAAITAMSKPEAPAARGMAFDNHEQSAPAESGNRIVLIGAENDSMTGANKAIEITDTSTMVTGG